MADELRLGTLGDEIFGSGEPALQSGITIPVPVAGDGMTVPIPLQSGITIPVPLYSDVPAILDSTLSVPLP